MAEEEADYGLDDEQDEWRRGPVDIVVGADEDVLSLDGNEDEGESDPKIKRHRCMDEVEASRLILSETVFTYSTDVRIRDRQVNRTGARNISEHSYGSKTRLEGICPDGTPEQWDAAGRRDQRTTRNEPGKLTRSSLTHAETSACRFCVCRTTRGRNTSARFGKHR